jgi:CTP-dependent riboflavin kinase
MSTVRAIRPFTQVYAEGWKALANLAGDALAVRLYIYLVEAADTENAVVVDYATLSEELEVSERTVRRVITRLEAGDHIVVARTGSSNVYVLNRQEVWKTATQQRGTISIRARALLSKKRNPGLKDRLQSTPRQADLLKEPLL